MIEAQLIAGDCRIDLLSRKVFRAGRECGLSATEFKLLVYLARQAPQTCLLWDIHIDVLGRAYQTDTNVLQVHVARLREKLGEPLRAPELLKTDLFGYYLNCEPMLLTQSSSWSGSRQ